MITEPKEGCCESRQVAEGVSCPTSPRKAGLRQLSQSRFDAWRFQSGKRRKALSGIAGQLFETVRRKLWAATATRDASGE